MSLRRILAFYLDCFFSIVIILMIFIVDIVYDYNFNFDNYFFGFWGLELISIYVYYFFCEYIFGNTLGKKIFKLKILNIKESNKLKQIFIRTSARFIPFDGISFLFNKEQHLWHDTLSNTSVIHKKNV